MVTSWPDLLAGFREATVWYVATTAKAVGRWDEPALGEWTVRDLVGHTSRSLLTVESYLAQGAAQAEVFTTGDYYRLAMAAIGDPAAVAQRGRDAGTALGDDIAAEVAAIADRVVPRIAGAGADDLVGTPIGGMRLADYLVTRTFELTVHTCDLAAALGLPLTVPPMAGEQSLAVVGDLAAHSDLAGPLLLAATGRRGLAPGFTVL